MSRRPAVVAIGITFTVMLLVLVQSRVWPPASLAPRRPPAPSPLVTRSDQQQSPPTAAPDDFQQGQPQQQETPSTQPPPTQAPPKSDPPSDAAPILTSSGGVLRPRPTDLVHASWVVVQRAAAERWWQHRFGDGWTCGVGGPADVDARGGLASRLHREFRMLLERTRQPAMTAGEGSSSPETAPPLSPSGDDDRVPSDTAVSRDPSWPILSIPWRDSTMFGRSCMPRLGDVRLDDAAVPLGVRSETRPSLGRQCLRGFMVLDGAAPSLELAMSRRCFRSSGRRRRRPASSTASKAAQGGRAAATTPFVVGIGHSHTRYLAAMLCMAVNLSWCSDFTQIQRLPYYPTDPSRVFGPIAETTPAPPAPTNADGTLADDGDWALTDVSGALGPPDRDASLRLMYASSYYDQRVTLERVLRWLTGHTGAGRAKWRPASEMIAQNFTPGLGVAVLANGLAASARGGDGGDDSGAAAAAARALDEKNDAVDEHLLTWGRSLLPHLARVPTHFLLSRGEWDLLYLDPDPWAMAQQLRRFIVVTARMFPGAALMLQLPQLHVSIPMEAGSSPRARRNNMRADTRNFCGSPQRIELLRNINLCAASLALASLSSSGKNNTDAGSAAASRPPARLLLLDSDRLTRSHFGHTFVDGTGHHYIDAALEVLALEVRRIVERADVAAAYAAQSLALLRRQGQAACHQVQKASKLAAAAAAAATPRPAALQRCTCHRDVQEDPSFCKAARNLGRDIG